MLLVFLGALSTAVLAACVVFVFQRLTGLNVRWLIPASAGAAMLGFTLWNDYAWFGRTSGALPETVAVVDVFTSSNVMQPWSLVVAPVNRFRALDLRSVAPHPAGVEWRQAAVFFVTRFNPTFVSPQVFDCAGSRRGDIGADGQPRDWVRVGADDALFGLVCTAPLSG